jgi:hypothetical protein
VSKLDSIDVYGLCKLQFTIKSEDMFLHEERKRAEGWREAILDTGSECCENVANYKFSICKLSTCAGTAMLEFFFLPTKGGELVQLFVCE